MDHAHKFDVLLAHEVDVSKATKFLLHQLDCDHWYVACHHETSVGVSLDQGWPRTDMRSPFNARLR